MSGDWFDNPDMKVWAKRVRAELVPMIQSSTATVSIVPTGDTDVKFAVELGLSIMLGKPIILLVMSGVQVPDKLVGIADEIVEVDDIGTGHREAHTGRPSPSHRRRQVNAPFQIAVDDVCECLPLPLVHWHETGAGWITIGDISGEGEVDAVRFNAGAYDAWIIRCPDCDLVYASGGSYA